MTVEIGAFKRQEVEVRPAGWEDYICNFLQRHQCGGAPFMPFVLQIRTAFIDQYGKRISTHKNACRQNVLMQSLNCRNWEDGLWALALLLEAAHIQLGDALTPKDCA
jgi:hypothetical protein